MSKKNAGKIEKPKEDEEELSDSVATYYDLSNHLRHAISRGYPSASHTSQKQDVHNLELSREFFTDKNNVDSPHRRKKDWLCKLY